MLRVFPKDITINLNVRHEDQEDVLVLLHRILHQGERIMAAVDDLKAILVRVDTSTTNIAADITAIKAKIGTGMTDAEVADVKAGLEAAASRLEALDAENPEGQP